MTDDSSAPVFAFSAFELKLSSSAAVEILHPVASGPSAC